MLELSCLLLVAFAVWMDLAAANSNPQPWRLTCGGATVSGSFTRAITSPASTLTFMGELCSSDQLQVESSAYWLCTDCLQRCPDRLDLLRGSNLVVSKQKPPASLKVGWFQMVSSANVAGPCTFVDSPMDVPEGSTEALRSFSKTSVLFVSISFIILMVISLAWLVFYYVQRFRYAHAKDRLQRRLFNAARKALARIPTRAVKAGDEELDTDCAVCLDPYQLHDIVRILPCKHVYHKSCIDPWLLEHRTCPMCKADILKYFGYQYYDGQCGRPEEMVGRVELGEREHHRSGDHRVILPEEIVSPEATSASSESNGFSFDHSENEAALAFAFTPPVAPQLVINVTNAKAFGGRVSSAGASTTSQRDIQPVTSLSARGHRTATANSAASQTEVSIMAINPQRVRSAGAGATSSGQGQIVNLVQVKTRAASSTRAATLRKESIAPQPTPIDAVVASSSSHPSV